MVQWLRLYTVIAGDIGLISGQGAEILHVTLYGKKKKKKKQKHKTFFILSPLTFTFSQFSSSLLFKTWEQILNFISSMFHVFRKLVVLDRIS